MTLTGKLFSIPPREPFLESLARAILSGRIPGDGAPPPDAFDLARYEIYLPNRAACRSLAQIFLDLSPRRATLLPRIRPLGSAEEDELLLLQAEIDDGLFRDTDLPVAPAMNAMERRLALSSLVLAWTRRLRDGGGGEPGLRIADTPAAASEMALDLMRLMDEAETEGADLSRLAEILPERFAEFEQLSLNFLGIVINIWPAFLDERGMLNPAERRNRLMALETERLRRAHPETPVIIAGSTGSIPATAELMKAVTGLAKGAIVVPGLDFALDDESWAALDQHQEHPQAGLFALLGTLGAVRGDVLDLTPQTSPNSRADFLSEAMRPSETLGRWPDYMESADRDAVREAMNAVCLIEAPDEQAEAATIAMALRDALETPGKTVSLVTPDQALARRVSAELRRWKLTVASANGESLRTSAAGRFYELIADYAATGDQIALLALLKHPLTRLGLPKEALGRLIPLIEIAAIRQPWCGDGIERLTKSIELARKKKLRGASLDQLTDEDWDALLDLAARIRTALSALSGLKAQGKIPLRQIAAAHIRAANAFAADGNGDSAALMANSDGEAMTNFLSSLAADVPGPELPLSDYPALFGSLIRLERTRAERDAAARIRILTPVQARLTSADLVVIAGLNDGTWPESADPGPWLNRTTRASLGLPPPERQTRLAAHDFCQLFSARQVVMTRALKVEGTPTVPSRWLLRLRTLLNGLGLEDALAATRPWLHWAAARNHAAPPPSAKAPAPCPPLAARPRSLTVSNIETLIANPYAIYASAILKLAPLNPLGADPGGAERGQIIHDVLHHFANRFGEELPDDCAREFLRLFDGLAALYGEQAHIQAFWRPRLERFAHWFAETEPARRGDALTLSEVRGSFRFMAPGGEFNLRARADRIDLHPDGTLAIYDYKSGEMPKEPAVTSFKAPQLPLEALIAREDGFEGIGSTRIAHLSYISAKGGEPAGEQLDLKTPAAELAEGAREGLATLIAKFDDPSTPYPALRRSLFPNGYRYDSYAHLARVAEWADEEDGEA
jgi:ATP-dependent helicase/nuclease subunit B